MEPSGRFFFRSGTARVALLRALATLGTLHLRYKIAQKNGLTAHTVLCYKHLYSSGQKTRRNGLFVSKGRR